MSSDRADSPLARRTLLKGVGAGITAAFVSGALAETRGGGSHMLRRR